MKPSIIPQPRKITYTGGISRANALSEIKISHSSEIPSEGYRLTLKNDIFHIICSDDAGEYYARNTVKQIISTCGCVCPNLEIYDFPAFAYRGFSLDCARHIFEISDIKKLIDAAALCKMNVFHWHLTDDQGWRIPIDGYPLLTQTGSRRKKSNFRGLKEEGEYGGFYQKDEIREIVGYCTKRHIEVIPEAEMPGHTTAILASYPEFGCTGKEIEVQTKEGIFDTVLCLGNEKIYDLIFAILDEICELFPGRYIHIGGDETPRTEWKKCEKCAKKAEELGITDLDAFQGQFIKSVAAYLRSKGKTAITWNESLKGGQLDPGDVMVQYWMGNKEYSDDFMSKGGRIIQSDFFHYYCDYPLAMTPLKKTYDFEPEKTGKKADSVYGIEAEMWTEFINTFEGICEKYIPRLQIIAERAWCSDDAPGFDSFVKRFERLRALTEQCGVKIPASEKLKINPLLRIPKIIEFFAGVPDFNTIKNSIFNSK